MMKTSSLLHTQNARQPYRKRLAYDWFMHHPHFLHYMWREFTCVAIGVYTLNMMAMIVALAQSEIHWVLWLQAQKNPALILINIIALIAAIYHSYTWFGVTPKVFKIQRGETFIRGKYIILAHWMLMISISLGLFILLV